MLNDAFILGLFGCQQNNNFTFANQVTQFTEWDIGKLWDSYLLAPRLAR